MSDVSQTSQLNWAIGCLDNELHVLTRLLYRNNNQHGKSIVFGHLKSLNAHLKLLNAEFCQKLIINLDTSVRLAKQHKQSQLQFEEILSIVKSVFFATKAGLIGIGHGTKSSDCLIKLLSNKVFVPLFSVLLALTSRIAKCLSILAVNFHSRCVALCEQLKHIGLIHEKYGPEVITFLKSVCLSDDELLQLAALKSVLEVHANGGTITNSSSSSGFKKKTLSFGELSQKSDSELLLPLPQGDEDTGDVVGTTISVFEETVIKEVSSDSDNDDATHCGMMIDSDVDVEEFQMTRVDVIRSDGVNSTYIKGDQSSSSSGKKRKQDPQNATVDVESSRNNTDANSLAIDPHSFFSAETVVEMPFKDILSSSVPDKTNFKKKKTLKALQRKADRMNRDKSKEKDDIDDIFGSFV